MRKAILADFTHASKVHHTYNVKLIQDFYYSFNKS